jgi:hypothetical protein
MQQKQQKQQKGLGSGTCFHILKERKPFDVTRCFA